MAAQRWENFLTPVGETGVTETIVRRIGELIGSGVLRPGDKLPAESALAERFQVATMTVRAALQALRDFDLVETRRGRHAGTFVRTDVARALALHAAELPSAQEFEDFTVWREAISGEATSRAATNTTPATATELRRLAAVADADEVAVEDARFADAELHLYIAELSGSPRLVAAEQQIQAYMTRALRFLTFTPDKRQFPAQAHHLLIASITAGDADGARRALHEHVRSTLDLAVGSTYLRSKAEPQSAHHGG